MHVRDLEITQIKEASASNKQHDMRMNRHSRKLTYNRCIKLYVCVRVALTLLGG
jgi:hypothetical protein